MSETNPELKITRRNLPHWRLEGSTYFVTWRLANECSELNSDERDELVGILRHFDGGRYELTAWVVMNDHVHVVVRPHSGFSLSQILHSWKSYSAHVLQRKYGRIGSVWQHEGTDHIVRDEQDLYIKCNYILQNPLRRWGVKDYPWMGFAIPQ